MLLRTQDQSLPQDTLMNHLRGAEQQVLHANLSFYRGLLKALDGKKGDAFKMAGDMAAGQLGILEAYSLT